MSGLSFSGVVGSLRRAVRHADGNVSGQAYGLTMFAPVKAGEEEALERHLEDLPVGAESPLARLSQLHCCRLHIIRQFVYQGGAQKHDHLHSAYLVFTASFDGDLDPFLADLCKELPAEADAIWGHCVGYPGTRDPKEFRRYVEHNQAHNHYFLTPYPDSTVQEVRAGLDLRSRVAEFAAQSQELDAPTLLKSFRRTFGRNGTTSS